MRLTVSFTCPACRAETPAAIEFPDDVPLAAVFSLSQPCRLCGRFLRLRKTLAELQERQPQPAADLPAARGRWEIHDDDEE